MNKIKNEELELIKEQQKSLRELTQNIGLIVTQKHAMLHEVAEVNKQIEDYKQLLESDYGQININLLDGSYTSIEEEAKDAVTEDVEDKKD
jgi:Lhr-like helicase|tara:strand:+ start:67 stop:339 length:273 start_codon:yes stop_codon:yes gene_type:complete